MDSLFKAGLKETVLALMAEKKEDLNAQLLALQEASNADTKSSMGDKYETGRESINQSRDLLEKQKVLLDRDEKIIAQTSVDPTATVSSGALVKVQLGWLWVAVSVGKVMHEGQEVQVVSADSPLVAALKGKRVGDKVAFRGRSTEILEVV
ncbi:hypothetical protein Q4534_03765 [Cyclobacterium sp. 1_MG-2023]|uniref:hypothetical protein n=1 Tax=Cyclobacterium sp. 1_MG-2023 TaxID=3062681 RepID=UPI0026E1B6E8|nr:hypothetical protein [Cyclobacterium sp. 1_MG-2023]MDO6436507.1 hypothetical protein [Cyclobacterium sp. 1_MG-2023]